MITERASIREAQVGNAYRRVFACAVWMDCPVQAHCAWIRLSRRVAGRLICGSPADARPLRRCPLATDRLPPGLPVITWPAGLAAAHPAAVRPELKTPQEDAMTYAVTI